LPDYFRSFVTQSVVGVGGIRGIDSPYVSLTFLAP
jgi:hypothetical protein